MQLTFWGVRGSVPSPEPWAWRYGGHTPCIEVRTGDQIFVLDAGTGARDLGHELVRQRSADLSVNILLSHYHWDHIQGLPFFEPLYYANTTLQFFGPPLSGKSAPATLSGVLDVLFRSPFFPLTLDQLKATYTLRELEWVTDYYLGLTRIRTCRLNHPDGSMAYRLDRGGVSVVYATDHEPGAPEFDEALVALARDADVLVCDAQYFADELRGAKRGVGHGTWQDAVRLAKKAGVKQLVLFHHDHWRSDDEVDQLLGQARREFPRALAASEGMVMDVARGETRVGSRRLRLSQRMAAQVPVEVETRLNGRALREQVQLENISFHGAYFLTPTRYEPQQPVELTVRLPVNGNGAGAGSALGKGRAAGKTPVEVRLSGYVLRSEPATLDSGWRGVAVHFPGQPATGKPESH